MYKIESFYFLYSMFCFIGDVFGSFSQSMDLDVSSIWLAKLSLKSTLCCKTSSEQIILI